MNTNLTDLTLVVDRSGSMDSIKTDAEGGVNSFIAEQAKESGEALVMRTRRRLELDPRLLPVKQYTRRLRSRCWV
jgi:hypothetical protein